MRIPVIILLVLAILTQSLSRGIILLSYYTNKDAYEKYCVNKARPQLHCDGKCQLAKKIKAADERDQKDPLKSSAFSEVVMICQTPDFHINLPFSPLYKEKLPHPLSLGHPLDRAASCFHPPSASATGSYS